MNYLSLIKMIKQTILNIIFLYNLLNPSFEQPLIYFRLRQTERVVRVRALTASRSFDVTLLD